VFAAALLWAQEDGSVGWDPKYVDGPLAIWQRLPVFALIALALFAYWRAARWFIDRRRDRPHYKLVRYWWPTLMVGVGGLAVLSENALRNNFGDWAVELSWGVAVFLNLPAALVALIVGPIIVTLNLTNWTAGAVTAPFLWLAWYALIRFLEHLSFRAAPISLRDNKTL
jgi:hypothetical protein